MALASPLTAIVVAFRSDKTLPRALAALRAESPPTTELIVVDNAGEPRTERLVREAWTNAQVISNPINRGFAGAVNQALAISRGEYVLLLNPDAELQSGALATLRHALAALPAAGIVAPRLLDSDGRPTLSCYPFLSLSSVTWRHFQLLRWFPDRVLGRYRRRALALAPVRPFPVDWAQGACLLARRAVLEEVGGFDERFVLYCEEVDLCLRAAAAGWHTYFVPAAAVRHAEGASTTQVVPLKLASHYLSKALYFDKHRGPAETSLLRGLLAFDLLARTAYRLVGKVRGRPPDAGQRLKAYLFTARLLLTASAADIGCEWRRQATSL